MIFKSELVRRVGPISVGSMATVRVTSNHYYSDLIIFEVEPASGRDAARGQ